MVKSTISMAIFNSYVSLPEGTLNFDELCNPGVGGLQKLFFFQLPEEGLCMWAKAETWCQPCQL